MGNEYLAVLKAAYDYTPQSDDEIAIKENQLLFLLDKSDDDWWKVRVRLESQEDEGPTGLVPAAYVEPADHNSTVKALYDYDAAAPGELSINEDETLLVFDTEGEWLLVQQQKTGGKAGFVPANYVEEASDAGAAPAVVATPHIVIPDSPPRPAYKDPETLVASTRKANSDAVQTWSVTEIDQKGKKKKGTLGVGNGAVFFASDSDKTPVQQWKTVDITSVKIDKGKHVLIELGGAVAMSLHFNAGAKDTAEEITAKLESSRALSAPATHADSDDEPAKKKNGASVHFDAAPTVIPPRSPSIDEASIPEAPAGEQAVAMYDFTADGEDELSVSEGEKLTVLERDSDDWWKVRNAKGHEGVVPASYVELAGGAATPTPAARQVDEDSDDDTATREAEERVRRERDEEARQRAEQARKAAAKTERDRARQEEERAEREREEREERERERERKREAEDRAKDEEERARKRKEKEARRAARAAEEEAAEKRRAIEERRSEDEKKRRDSKNRKGPPPEKTRVWHDKTGQFRVEAQLLGFNDGKLKLHKANGVIIEVPSEKMSAEDMEFVKKVMAKTAPPSRPSEDDEIPLAVRRASLATAKKAPKTDWFEFFLNAGCDIDDCSRYAQSFDRDRIDESILGDLPESTMRSLGLREGDIIRVKKVIESRKPKKEPKDDTTVQDQIRKDEEIARRLQNGDENAGKVRTTSPAPNLFAAPDGTLKDNTKRRGRPQPSKSLPPTNVDLISLDNASKEAGRSASPLVASPTGGAESPAQPARPASAAAPSGFDDDAWTNRPSSKPATPSPAVATSPAPRAPSAPPAPAPPPAQAPLPQTIPSVSEPTPAQSQAAGLAQKTENDVFEQLARLSQLRTQSPALQQRPGVVSPPVAPPVISSPAITSPPPASYGAGLGMGASPVPMGQHLQAQQAGVYQAQPPPAPQNGPRGPYAPVPANQGLLNPLVPTTTGFNSFVPTRPMSTPSSFQPGTQQSFLQPQATGFPGGQTMGGSLIAQPTGFGGAMGGPLMSQPTGFTPSPILSQPTGMQSGGFGAAPMSGPLMSQPTGFAGGSMFQPQNASFGVQTNPTGFNPGMNGMQSAPPSANKDVSPANVFAQMKSGTFGSDSAPQSADKYDALRPQATGWGFQGGMQQGYQSGFGYQR